MKKLLAQSVTVIVLLLLFSGFLSSCKKESIETVQDEAGVLANSLSAKKSPNKPFSFDLKTWYRFSPLTNPEDIGTIIVDGNTYVYTGHFPGGGEGKATHLGQCYSYFNQKAFAVDNLPTTPPAGSISAPAIDAANYPDYFGPLPLIQPGDFTGLGQISSALGFPAMSNGQIVSSILFDKKGNAVYFSYIDGTSTSQPLGGPLFKFNGKAAIVGGRGKFANATGEVDYEVIVSFIDPDNASYTGKGTISY